MSGDDCLMLDGVIDSVNHDFFYVKYKMANADQMALCKLCGKMRKNNIKVMPGDNVQFRLDEYNPQRGIIKFRSK
jgi:translation initiation factor IF-1